MSPVVRGRRLAAALRRLRLASGRTVEEVAQLMECSAAKISRIENNLVTLRIQDAKGLLDVYEVDGEERERLLGLVRDARKRAWWFEYADLLGDGGFDRFITFEEEAVDIWMLEAHLVPGVFQTEPYAASLMSSRRDVPSQMVERMVRLRMERQQVLTRSDPPVMHILLDEAALRRRVGPPAVMAGQYRRLIAEAGTPNISLRVLPLDAEPHQAPGFSFTIFGFADPADPKIAFEELLEGTNFHERVEVVGRYVAAFEHARSCAWDEAASVQFLADLAQQSE